MGDDPLQVNAIGVLDHGIQVTVDQVHAKDTLAGIGFPIAPGALQLVKASGGSTVYLEHEITNKFIDIMMTQVHIANISDPYENDYGASMLGIEVENLML